MAKAFDFCFSLFDRAKTTQVGLAQWPMKSVVIHDKQKVLTNGAITLEDCYRIIKSDDFRNETENLRRKVKKETIAEIKRTNFPVARFAGIFENSSGNGLVKLSGATCLDFDRVIEYQSKDTTALQQLKEQLINDPYFDTLMLFVSPKGNGLKWVIDISSFLPTSEPNEDSRRAYTNTYIAICNYVERTYMKADVACKNIDRACYLPHDPECFFNFEFFNPFQNENKRF